MVPPGQVHARIGNTTQPNGDGLKERDDLIVRHPLP
jgi:hypothetical protein